MNILYDWTLPPQAGGIRVSLDTTRRWLTRRGHTEWQPDSPGRPDVALFTWYGVEKVHEWAGKVPVVFFVDSWWHLTAVGQLPRLAVFNTDYLRENAPWRMLWADMRDRPGPYPGDAITVHPPVLEEEWATPFMEDRMLITLVNMSRRKGSDLFWKLAERLPHRRFAGVVGTYGTQNIRQGGNVPPNVEIFSYGPASHLKWVFEKTGTLIVPSQETYGRVLVEAAYNQVPHRLALAGPGVDETGCASLLPDLEEGKWEKAVELPPTPPFAPPDSEAELVALEARLESVRGPVRSYV